LVGDFEMRRRRGGHLVSKSRYVAAQLLAFLESGVWRRNAERANRLAQRLVAGLAVTPLYPVDANELFLALGENGKRRLREAGFEFDDWGPCGSGEARFVVSWDQRDQDVEALGAALGRLG
jgi:threonine aldolase